MCLGGTDMFKKYKVQVIWGLTAFISVGALILFYFLVLRWKEFGNLMNKLANIIAPVTIGLFIAYILDSLVKTMKKGMNRCRRSSGRISDRAERLQNSVAILLSEIIMIALIVVLMWIVVPQVISSIMMIVSNLGVYREHIRSLIEPLMEKYPDIAVQAQRAIDNVGNLVDNFIKNDMMTAVSVLSTGLMSMGASVYHFILGAIVSVYLLASKKRLIGVGKKSLYTLFGPEKGDQAMIGVRYANRVFKGFFVGKLLDSLIIGVLCFIGVTIFGMPYSVLISIVVGVTNVIPYFGPFIGAIPSALLILVVDPTKCLIFCIFILVLQQLDGNVIGPKVLKNTTGVSSLGVLISILVGGGLFGVGGMLVSVPAYAVLCMLVRVWCNKRLIRQKLPTESEVYIESDYFTKPAATDLLMQETEGRHVQQ